MQEATLNVEQLENEDHGVEYVYNELEKQGKIIELKESENNKSLSNS